MHAVDGDDQSKDGPTYGGCACVEAILYEFFDGCLEVNNDLT